MKCNPKSMAEQCDHPTGNIHIISGMHIKVTSIKNTGIIGKDSQY